MELTPIVQYFLSLFHPEENNELYLNAFQHRNVYWESSVKLLFPLEQCSKLLSLQARLFKDMEMI